MLVRDRKDVGVRHHRRREGCGIALQARQELVAAHEPVRVLAAIRRAGQSVQPVWREKPERIPAMGLPTSADLSALEYGMVDPTDGEAVAHCKPCLAGADDGDVSRVHVRLHHI